MKESIAPFVRTSMTSLEAAKDVHGIKGVLRQRVYTEIYYSGTGLTDEQIQEALEMNPSTQRPRRIELLRESRIRDSGRRRPTRSGRKAVVWEVAATSE